MMMTSHTAYRIKLIIESLTYYIHYFMKNFLQKMIYVICYIVFKYFL